MKNQERKKKRTKKKDSNQKGMKNMRDWPLREFNYLVVITGNCY